MTYRGRVSLQIRLNFTQLQQFRCRKKPRLCPGSIQDRGSMTLSIKSKLRVPYISSYTSNGYLLNYFSVIISQKVKAFKQHNKTFMRDKFWNNKMLNIMAMSVKNTNKQNLKQVMIFSYFLRGNIYLHCNLQFKVWGMNALLQGCLYLG